MIRVLHQSTMEQALLKTVAWIHIRINPVLDLDPGDVHLVHLAR